MRAANIKVTSWEDFFKAVEQMRNCQKEYYRTRSPAALNASKRYETAIDAFIKAKHTELARQKQPELEVTNNE
jgi:hypothetical protein